MPLGDILFDIVGEVLGEAVAHRLRRISCSTAIILFLLLLLAVIFIAKELRAREVKSKAAAEAVRRS